MHFLGLLPMIDPPRYDTAITVRRLMDAGVEAAACVGVGMFGGGRRRGEFRDQWLRMCIQQ